MTSSDVRTDQPNREFESLLEYLKKSRAFDFTGYKRSSLMRRVDKRLQMLEIETYSDYGDYLEVHPDEFAQLFNTILINVTAFFRDPAAWQYLQEEIIPKIASQNQTDPIRIWSAGCASGEEAYTLAMILAETLGPDEFRERVKIYATDIDEDALNRARLASYSSREVAGVPEPLLDRYFERHSTQYTLVKDLRRAVIFGRHDLIQDAPISRIDLIACRNALMYFNAEVQTKILARLHFALTEQGYLFLGKAEMLFTHTNLFAPADLKRRIFTRVRRTPLRDRLLQLNNRDGANSANPDDHNARMREAAFDCGPVAQVIIDATGALSHANERARSMFRLGPRDLGRPLQDLELSYRPVELRSMIEHAYSERRSTAQKEVGWPPSITDTRYVDVQVQPMFDPSGAILGASVCFIDVTRYKQLQEELQESNRELETAYEELQSTNEELETMNEELQSTNEELETINDELRQRSSELNHVNAYMSSILASLQGGVVVVDRDLEVQVWNYTAEELWGLRAEEVRGRHFLNLDIGLPAEQLIPPIRQLLAGETKRISLTLDAVNRRGKTIRCMIDLDSLVGTRGEIQGVIIMIKEEAAPLP